MLKFVQHRVADRRILRLIQKWLNAGVMEEGKWSETERGTPQGAVISPLLANIYLHYAFDLWVEAWRKKCAQGDVVVVRYADDTVLGFQAPDRSRPLSGGSPGTAGEVWVGTASGQDAPDRVRAVRRTEPETKGRREARDVRLSGLHAHQREEPEGVLHGEAQDDRASACGRSCRRSSSNSASACTSRSPRTGEWLQSVVQGYFNYHAVPGNLDSLGPFGRG